MAEETATSGRDVKRLALLAAIGVLALLLAWWIGAAVIPRWWAQRIGGIVDGRLTVGTLVGIATGAVFTALPLIVLAVGWRLRKGWKRLVGFVLVAALAAFPNLATLGIVFGDGNAAHAGDRILDVDGPGFRGGSLVGAVVAVIVAAGVAALAWSRRRNKNLAEDRQRALDARG